MRTEGVLDRLFSGGAVMTAVETDGDEGARLLEQRYGSMPPTLPRERTSHEHATTEEELTAAVNYRRVFDHLFGDLKTVHTGLASAEDEHQRKLMQIEDLVHRREEVGEHLQDLFFKVRHTLETLYSKTQRTGRRWRRGFVLASVAGATPRTPRRFLEQVAQTEKFLRQPAVDPPSLELNGVKVDFVELADDLKPVRQEYGDLLDAIDRVRKEAQSTLAAKNEAIKEFDQIFGWVSRAFETYFHLAGLHELAELIRPSVRRPGRRAVDEAASGGEPSGEDSPAESSSTEASTEDSSTEPESAPVTATSPDSES